MRRGVLVPIPVLLLVMGSWSPLLSAQTGTSAGAEATRTAVLETAVVVTVLPNLPEKALFKAVAAGGRIVAVKFLEDDASVEEVAGAGQVYIFDPRTQEWAAGARMLLKRSGFQLTSVGDRVFVIGGFSAPDTPDGGVQEYDATRNRWTRKTDMPTARSNMGLVVLDGRIYMLGGRTAGGGHTDAVEAYDPRADTWAVRRRLSDPAMSIHAVAAKGRIFKLKSTRVQNGRWEMLMDFEEYDPAANVWTKKAAWTFQREPVDLALADGRLFAVGAGAHTGQETHSLREYEFASDRWVVRSDMPAASAHTIHPAVAVVGGRIYTFGGGFRASNGWRWSNRAQRYDPRTDRWEELPPLSEARLYMPAVPVGNRIFVFGGETSDESSGRAGSKTFSGNVDVYTLGGERSRR